MKEEGKQAIQVLSLMSISAGELNAKRAWHLVVLWIRETKNGSVTVALDKLINRDIEKRSFPPCYRTTIDDRLLSLARPALSSIMQRQYFPLESTTEDARCDLLAGKISLLVQLLHLHSAPPHAR